MTENTTSPSPTTSYPTLEQQFFAWGIDAILLFIFYFSIPLLAYVLHFPPLSEIFIPLLLLIMLGYFVVCWKYFRGQTIGEKLFDLRIYNQQMYTISLSQAIIRSILMNIYFLILGLRYIMLKLMLGNDFAQITTPQWHEVLSKTKIVHVEIPHEQKSTFYTIFYTIVLIFVGILVVSLLF